MADNHGPAIAAAELEVLFDTLAQNRQVNLGVGDPRHPGWFRARVVAHHPAEGRLVLTYLMDRPGDRPLQPGERVVVAASRGGDQLHLAPLDVEASTTGAEARVALRFAGAWQPEDERRHQVRVATRIRPRRARRWSTGAWHDLDVTVVDLSPRGVGVALEEAVQVGQRLTLVIPLNDGAADLRVNVEIKHVRRDSTMTAWRAGGQFRGLAPADHERVIRFIFAELRAREYPVPR